MKRPVRACAWRAALLGIVSALPAVAQDIPSPEQVLGFRPGADSVLADWGQIQSYLEILATRSDRVALDTVGRSTLGRPLLLLQITSPANHRRAENIGAIQRLLADPRRIDDASERTALASQPAVLLINNNIHSTEIASSLFGLELAHRLATREDYGAMLDSLVVLIIPSTNPDGLDAVVSWYRRYRGTAYEGGPLPWLYHPYAGHDNNRDWYMLTQIETRAYTRVLYRDWLPHVVWDVHQMDRFGARFFLPPFAEPVNPNLDSIQVAATASAGRAMSAALTDSGYTGLASGVRFDQWWHGGFRTVPARHNMIAILSEAAGARLASPLTVGENELMLIAAVAERVASDRGERSTITPTTDGAPWQGGRWGLREIIDYELIAADGLLRHVYSRREEFIGRFLDLGRRAIARGTNEPPYAFLIPQVQRDPGAFRTLQRLLLDTGIELQRATEPVTSDGRVFPAGTIVIDLAQPFRAHVKDLLEVQQYPAPGDGSQRPYDVAGWTLQFQMGISVIPVTSSFSYTAERMLEPFVTMSGETIGTGNYFVLTNQTLAESRAIAAALASGSTARVLRDPILVDNRVIPAGSVVISEGDAESILTRSASANAFVVHRIADEPPGDVIRGLPRIGIYRPWTANADEGWTRWAFESHGIGFRTVGTAALASGSLLEDFDVLVLPSMSEGLYRNGLSDSIVPAVYSGGLGDTGIAALKDFADGGGVIVALGEASRFVISALSLPIRDVTVDTGENSGSRFWASGSIFGMIVEGNSAISSGLPDSIDVFFRDGGAFETTGNARVIARFGAEPLRSGFAGNQRVVAGKGSLVDVPVGRGRAILFGFRPQHRGQTFGTFKALFNAVLLSGLP